MERVSHTSLVKVTLSLSITNNRTMRKIAVVIGIHPHLIWFASAIKENRHIFGTHYLCGARHFDIIIVLEGTTVIIVTHDLNVAAHYNRVVKMLDGVMHN